MSITVKDENIPDEIKVLRQWGCWKGKAEPWIADFLRMQTYWEITVSLKGLHGIGRGIPYHVIGQRSIRYRLADVMAFMEAQRITFDEVTR